MKFTKANINKLTKMQHKADTYRGMIIGFSTTLESKMNQFLSEYFVPDYKKRNKFVKIFFSANGLNFRYKQKALTHIIKTDNRFEPFLTVHPKFIDDLDIAISRRNDMAHSKLLSTIENIENFDGNNFILQSFSSKFKEKKIPIDFRTLKPEADKILALSITIDEILAINIPDLTK